MKKVVISLFFLLFALAFFATPSFALHGGFTENTNTCFRCHDTHQADAKSLLNKNDVYQTCMSCHDGTTGSRSVNRTATESVFNENSPNAAGHTARVTGTFAGASSSMSAHLSSSVVKISAAPGGTTNPDAPGNWQGTFSCDSCHNAHGSYSSKVGRYLSNNPNGMVSVPVEQGGRALKDVPVVTTIDNNGPEFVFHNVEGKLTLKRKVQISNKGQYTTYWVEDKSPWMKVTPKTAIGTTVTADVTINANINNATTNHVPGLVPNITGAGINNIAKVDVERAYYVEAPANKSEYWQSTKVVNGATVPNMAGIQLSEFCSSCHSDYLVKSGGSTSVHSGESFYGHTTNSSSYTCVRCHYAHGTDANLMIDANGNSVFSLQRDRGLTLQQAQSHMNDTNSSLKKFVGSSSCWACHNSSKATNVVHDGKVTNDRPKTGMPAGR
ncbi:cytochrome c3 family protein [Anaerobacillus sp. CMMVII]|uniref:cytochrome c3 family protein n=1 Tax=Anaerobacillus sp. CMMVII TaxID=2755588 RepID=UPI0021B70487|nr:cytochrome c3 family protein [Anaerobacillus sp. CMMVII]MCT8137715.1 cytochrome c3 family protein [Anaerobacillus sp. CMMVII]